MNTFMKHFFNFYETNKVFNCILIKIPLSKTFVYPNQVTSHSFSRCFAQACKTHVAERACAKSPPPITINEESENGPKGRKKEKIVKGKWVRKRPL